MRRWALSANRFTALLMFLGLVGWAAVMQGADANKAFRGVIGVRAGEAGIDDTIEVKVRDLDGWLLEEIMQKRISGGEHFKGNQFEQFLKLQQEAESKSGTEAKDKTTYGDLLTKEAERLSAAFEKTGKGNPKPEVTPAEAKQQLDALKKEQDQWYSEIKAWQDWKALSREIQENLYLVLGSGHLRHVKALNSFEKGKDDGDGITVQIFKFRLKKQDEDVEQWDKLYHGADQRVPVSLTVGFNLGGRGYMLDTLVRPTLKTKGTERVSGFSEQFVLVTYQTESMCWGLGLVGVALIAFGLLAKNEAIVRDPDAVRPGGNKFSLARCQTAFWFFLFTAAYIFLWVIKRQTDILTEQCLVLLGISTGTTLGAAMIKVDEASAAPVDNHGEGRTPFAQFFTDLLSDGSGEVMFHRFQTLVWTLVLGFVFIKSVFFSLQIPVFGANELILMGISGATYVGFKFQSKAANAQDAPAPQARGENAEAQKDDKGRPV